MRALADHVVNLPCSVFPRLRVFVRVLVSNQKADVTGASGDPNCASASSQFRRSCPCAVLSSKQKYAPCGSFPSVPICSVKGSAHVLCDLQVVFGLGSHQCDRQTRLENTRSVDPSDCVVH